MISFTQSTICSKGEVFGRCEWPIFTLKLREEENKCVWTAFEWLPLQQNDMNFALIIVRE